MRYGLRHSLIMPGAEVYGANPSSFSPLSLSPILWLKSDVGLYTDAAKTTLATNYQQIYTWADQSSNGRDTIMASVGYRPRVRTDLGKPVVYYGGINNTYIQLMKTASFQSFASKRGAAFVVFMHSAAPNGTAFATFVGTAPSYMFKSTSSGAAKYKLYDGAWRNASDFEAPNIWLRETIHYIGDTTCKYYRQGILEDTFTVTNQQFAANPFCIGGINVGGDTGGDLRGAIGEIILFNDISDANRQLVEAYLESRWGSQTPCVGTLVFDGNSMTRGTGAAEGKDYPNQVIDSLASKYYHLNFGIDGRTTATMISLGVANIDACYEASTPCVVICWEGTNELNNGVSADDAYAHLVTYCQARQTKGFDVIILTILPRSSAGTPPGFEAARQAVNTNIRTNWATFADALADVAADARIGDAGDELDTTYYAADKVHMNDTGYGVVAGIVKTAIESL